MGMRDKLSRFWSGKDDQDYADEEYGYEYADAYDRDADDEDVYGGPADYSDVYESANYERAQERVDAGGDGAAHALVHGNSDRNGKVRPLQLAKTPQRRRIVTVHPTTFDDATLIADTLKAGDPVIMNLSDANVDLCRRMVDFASGVVYILDGNIETITSRVYLLSGAEYEFEAEGPVAATGRALRRR